MRGSEARPYCLPCEGYTDVAGQQHPGHIVTSKQTAGAQESKSHRPQVGPTYCSAQRAGDRLGTVCRPPAGPSISGQLRRHLPGNQCCEPHTSTDTRRRATKFCTKAAMTSIVTPGTEGLQAADSPGWGLPPTLLCPLLAPRSRGSAQQTWSCSSICFSDESNTNSNMLVEFTLRQPLF